MRRAISTTCRTARGACSRATCSAPHTGLAGTTRPSCCAERRRRVLTGKRIVVTGASGGIGRAIAARCAREGALVGVHYHANREIAEALAVEISGFCLGFDVRDPAALGRELERFVRHAGGID